MFSDNTFNYYYILHRVSHVNQIYENYFNKITPINKLLSCNKLIKNWLHQMTIKFLIHQNYLKLRNIENNVDIYFVTNWSIKQYLKY